MSPFPGRYRRLTAVGPAIVGALVEVVLVLEVTLLVDVVAVVGVVVVVVVVSVQVDTLDCQSTVETGSYTGYIAIGLGLPTTLLWP